MLGSCAGEKEGGKQEDGLMRLRLKQSEQADDFYDAVAQSSIADKTPPTNSAVSSF